MLRKKNVNTIVTQIVPMAREYGYFHTLITANIFSTRYHM